MSALVALGRFASSHASFAEHSRRRGELLKETPKAKGTRGKGKPSIFSLGGSKNEPPIGKVPTLADMGIDKKLSSRDGR